LARKLGRPRYRIVTLVGAVAVLLAAGYLGLGVVLFNNLSRVDAGCGTVGSHVRFDEVTPATLHYQAADFGSTDTVASIVLGMDLSPFRMPEFQDVRFMSRPTAHYPSVSIRAWWVPASKPDAPAVIFVHGRGSCRKDWNVEIPAGMLHRAGMAALMLDLRNQGDSAITDGRYYGGLIEQLDVLGAWDWLVSSRGISAAHIGLFGASLGAASVLLAAASEPGVAAIWEDGGYADAEQRVEEELQQRAIWLPSLLAPAGGFAGILVSGIDIYGSSPLSAVKRLAGRPLFIAHGAADAATPVHHAQDLDRAAREAGAVVDLWIVPFAGHTWEVVVDPAGYEQRLDAFFRRHIQRKSGERSPWSRRTSG
jgi:dipeptidyl aminopeptidase/acylaminoacyl peptidase